MPKSPSKQSLAAADSLSAQAEALPFALLLPAGQTNRYLAKDKPWRYQKAVPHAGTRWKPQHTEVRFFKQISYTAHLYRRQALDAQGRRLVDVTGESPEECALKLDAALRALK